MSNSASPSPSISPPHTLTFTNNVTITQQTNAPEAASDVESKPSSNLKSKQATDKIKTVASAPSPMNIVNSNPMDNDIADTNMNEISSKFAIGKRSVRNDAEDDDYDAFGQNKRFRKSDSTTKPPLEHIFTHPVNDNFDSPTSELVGNSGIDVFENARNDNKKSNETNENTEIKTDYKSGSDDDDDDQFKDKVKSKILQYQQFRRYQKIHYDYTSNKVSEALVELTAIQDQIDELNEQLHDWRFGNLDIRLTRNTDANEKRSKKAVIIERIENKIYLSSLEQEILKQDYQSKLHDFEASKKKMTKIEAKISKYACLFHNRFPF